jgi:NitT/TauT family transport system substrate-binding protein
LAGCTGSTVAPPTVDRHDAPSARAALRPVTIGLNWFPEAEHGGFYAAVVHGYFAAEGLEVTIVPGGKQSPVLQQTATGQLDFAVDNADKLLLVRAQEADVVAVMAPLQDSPRCLMVHEESSIQTFADLATTPLVTLSMNPGQPFAQYLKHRLPLENVPQEPYSGNISRFLLDRNYVQQAYSFSEPFLAEQQGAKPRLLMLSELGFNTYTSVLMTRAELLTSDAALVRSVVAASVKGWEHYLRDPGPTNEFIHRLNPEMSLAVLEYGVTDIARLCRPAGVTLGTMTAERWETLVRQMEESESLRPGAVRADQAFTLEFLPK